MMSKSPMLRVIDELYYNITSSYEMKDPKGTPLFHGLSRTETDMSRQEAASLMMETPSFGGCYHFILG